MGRRDYEMEAAVAAVEGRVTEPVGRALIVGAPGSQEGTLGGALNSLQPVVVQCPRTDSARTTIQALEGATGSKPSRITARRRNEEQREREEAARESQTERS
jgi:hypothetical protein